MVPERDFSSRFAAILDGAGVATSEALPLPPCTEPEESAPVGGQPSTQGLAEAGGLAPNNAGDGSSSGVSATTAVMIASQATTVAAQVAGGAEIARYAKDPITGQELWKGKNGKLYTGNFNGNQHTGGKLNYARAGSNTARVAGRVLFVAGAGFAVNDMYHGARANDGLKVAQGGLDLMVGALGTWGAPVGWAFAGGYFAGRALGDFIFGPPGG